jgi:multidrug resistance efflux pump
MADSENKNPGTLSERVRSLRLTETNEAGGNTLWWLPWVVCLLLLCATGFFALEALSPIDDELVKKLAEERGLNVGKPVSQTSALDKLGVSNSSAGAAPTEISLESKGYIVPISLIQVSPKVSGTVMKLFIKEGMRVEKDAVLAELEAIEYQSDMDRAEGAKNAAKARLSELQEYRPDEVLQAKAELEDAKAQYDQMFARYTRSVPLQQRGAIAPEEFESAESAYRSMKSRVARLQTAYDLLSKKGPRDARIDAVKAERMQAEADETKAKWRLDNTKVKAPIKGIILSKKTEEGNIVNPSAFSNGLSASLCEMADLHELEVDLSIAERDIGKLFKDQDCRVRAEAFPDRIYKGHISRIMPMADRSKSAVPVRVKIEFPAIDAKGQALPKDEQGEYLRPEMGAIVTFLNRKASAK